MYKRKADFIGRLAKALTAPAPQGSNLIDLRYEVYEGPSQSRPDESYYEEFVVLVFNSVECPVCTNGNSDSANLRVVANHISGGGYEDVYFYKHIKSTMQQVI